MGFVGCTMVTFTVPGQPQGKGRAKIVKIGGFSRMATPAKTVAYEGLVAHAAAVAMEGRPPIEGPCQVVIGLFCQVPTSWSQKKRAAALACEIFPTTKPDADNCVKAIFDGMNGVVWRDDVQAVDLKVVKQYSVTPSVMVDVRGL
jgi:Holliday junction resolvase RusA-like endonuclease